MVHWYNAKVRKSLKRQRSIHTKMKKTHPDLTCDKIQEIRENSKKVEKRD